MPGSTGRDKQFKPVPKVRRSFLKESDLIPHPRCLQAMDRVALDFGTRGSTKVTWDWDPIAKMDPSSLTFMHTFSRAWGNLEFNV